MFNARYSSSPQKYLSDKKFEKGKKEIVSKSIMLTFTGFPFKIKDLIALQKTSNADGSKIISS